MKPKDQIILQVDELSKVFGKLHALKNVSFNVKEGEILGIAGPNGAGKTTLFNAIAGRISSSGKIIFNGVNISNLKPHQICHSGIGRTFQTPRIFSTMTVRQNLEVGAHFGLQKSENEDEIIDEIINFIGLEGKENIIAANLDLLGKKKTMLAAVLVTKPKLLLLDEPIGGLGAIEIEDFLNLIQKIKKKVSIIIIEHLMRVLMSLSHRMMILCNGEKICLGSPQEIAEDKKVIEVYLGENYA